jgi:putative copper export protein
VQTVLLVLHVLGATVWTGGHLVLSLTVLPRALRAGDPRVVHEFESGFEKLAIPALAMQVATGLALAFRRLPDAGDWLALDYPANHVLAKLALLAATVGLAVHARLRVLPDLDRERLRLLAWHVVPVTVLAVLLVVVGVSLGNDAAASG